MNKKKMITALVAVTAVTTMTTGCGKNAKLKTDDETVVAVSKAKITAEDLYKELKKGSIQTLVEMMDHKIFDKKYKETDAEKEYVQQQIDQIKNYYTDEEQYLSVIKSYFGVDTEDELRVKLSLEYKRKQAINDYLKDNIKDDEINKYYDENVYGDIKASHILISVDAKENATDDEKEKAKEKALNKAKKVIDELNNGGDFAKLAKKYSTDKATAKNGGDLGYFNKDDMDANFWNAALNLEKGKYSSEPVESSYGYHIILKVDTKEKKSLKSMKSEIKEKLAQQKLDTDKTVYYDTLMSIREDNKMTFGDSELEKEYKEYMDTLKENAKKNNTTEQ